MYSLRSRVKHLMFLDQRFRDSDKALVLQIWEECGLVLNKRQRIKFMEAPSADVIIRRRREFGQQFPASKKVMDKRYKAFQKEQKHYSKWFPPFLRKQV